MPIGEIDTGLVLKVLQPVWTVKAETASRLRGRIEAVLDWAKARGYRVCAAVASSISLRFRRGLAGSPARSCSPSTSITVLMGSARRRPGMASVCLVAGMR